MLEFAFVIALFFLYLLLGSTFALFEYFDRKKNQETPLSQREVIRNILCWGFTVRENELYWKK